MIMIKHLVYIYAPAYLPSSKFDYDQQIAWMLTNMDTIKQPL